MPRVGTNPLQDATLSPSPRMVAAVITHLPSRAGYHEYRFEVIEACIKSVRETCNLPLYVWDNGSDAAFREWLIAQRPEYLTLSPNIGKASARTAIMRAFPPKTVVCISDDDIKYFPNWLPAHLELLEGFPNVGVVSGCPVRTSFRWGNEFTKFWAREHATLRVGKFIPEQWDYDFCISIGRDYLWHLGASKDDMDYVIEHNGLSAYATAHHMQFVCYNNRIDKALGFTNKAMRQEQGFDYLLDFLKLLRLTTLERYTIHLGNVLEVA